MTISEITHVAPLEVDQDEENPVCGPDDLSAYTQSLRSSIIQGVDEHGRQYHRYGASNKYVMPEDADEQDRLDLQHDAFLRTFSGKLLLSPIPEHVDEVLDIGTGTGIWAIDFADQHPGANVVGTDLSPIQPTLVPPNCKFVIDDFESGWVFSQKFDVIHGRMLNSSMGSPLETFKKAYDALKPGGWFEIQDCCLPGATDDDSIPAGSHYRQWVDTLHKAIQEGLGRDTNWPMRYKEWAQEAGFQGVEEVRFKWPINTWPKDPKYKILGQLTMVNLSSGLEGFSYRPLMDFLAMSREEVESLLVKVRADIQNPRIHAYWPIFVVYGQKPKE